MMATGTTAQAPVASVCITQAAPAMPAAATHTAPLMTGKPASTVKTCKFGASCRAASCRFAHPPPLQPAAVTVGGGVIIESGEAGAGSVGAAAAAAAGDGSKGSIKLCKFGAACRTVACRFAHPAAQLCASSGADEAVHPSLVRGRAGAGAGEGGRGGGAGYARGDCGRGAPANGRAAPRVQPHFEDLPVLMPAFRTLEEIERVLLNGAGVGGGQGGE